MSIRRMGLLNGMAAAAAIISMTGPLDGYEPSYREIGFKPKRYKSRRYRLPATKRSIDVRSKKVHRLKGVRP